MKRKDRIVSSAIASLIALMSVSITQASAGTTAEPENNERCYGIAKKGMNDCKTATQNCAGSSTVDNQGDAFIFLPKGVCTKLVNASTQPITPGANQAQNNIPGQSVPPHPGSPDQNIPEEERD